MIIPIHPVACWPTSGTQLSVDGGKVQLGVTASFMYSLLNSTGTAVFGPERCFLTTGQYANWVGDDEYVCICVAQNIGITPL